jgi:hypothetical protein
MPEYDVEALPRAAVSLAFPLMHMVTPGLDLQAWRRFAHMSLLTSRARPAGILVARRRARRLICGLVCYRLEAELPSGRVLRARNLVGIDILDPGPIILLLIQNLLWLARSNDCSAVHIRVPDAAATGLLRGLLHGDGLHGRVRHPLDVEVLLPSGER